MREVGVRCRQGSGSPCIGLCEEGRGDGALLRCGVEILFRPVHHLAVFNVCLPEVAAVFVAPRPIGALERGPG